MTGVVDQAVDGVAEFAIVPSFTRLGYEARRRTGRWDDLNGYDLTGRDILLTGGTSGIGRAAVEQLVRMGATVTFTGRTHERNEQVRAEIERLTGTSMPDPIAADMGDLDQVRELAGRIAQCEVLIHNAGALTAEYTVGANGIESTVASQVVGPFLLTALLADRLKVSGRGRVLTMASGGMYTAAVTVSQLEMTPDEYNGTTQYARAKRAQVTLNEMWATRFATSSDSTADAVVAHALHPGWVDTPGVEQALPVFRKTVGPLLRTPAQGADTLVWLAADDTKPLAQTGLFWHDRRPRPIHRLGSTRRSDTSDRRNRLWDWCVDRCGVDFE